MSNPLSKPTLEQLDYWNKKLEQSGFKDIEQPDGKLKVWHNKYFATNYHKVNFEAKETYYRLAGFFLNDHKFDTKLEKDIWELHVEGIPQRTIAILLKKRRFKVFKRLVQDTIEKLTSIMEKTYNG